MKHWYVVHTHVNGEKRAEINLLRQEFECWLPKYRKNRRHAGKQETVLRPMFPRYLFIRIDIEKDQWRPILSTYGVASIVGDKNGPYPIEDQIIEEVKKRAGIDGIFDLVPKTFSAGEKVRIASGPLADWEAIFQEKSDSKRVLVLLSLMGREIKASILTEDVESV